MSSVEKQKLLLSYLVAEPAAFAMCRAIMAQDRFDMELRPVVKYLLEHSDKYKTIPNLSMIAVETGLSLPPIEDERPSPARIRWVCDEIETHCRTMATVNAVIEASDLIHAGKLDAIIEPIKQAVLVSLQRDLGLDYFSNVIGRLKLMEETNSPIPTGLKHLDQVLAGGVYKGGVNIFVARSGGGKSMMLANMAVNALERGDNVVYISLELNSDKIAKRIDSMLTGIAGKLIFDRKDEVHRIVTHKAKTFGKLRIKRMPSGSSTAQISAYIKSIELELDFVPQIVIVDYLDIVNPASNVDLNNINLKDKTVTEELRNIAHELDVGFHTASQLTKGSDGQDGIEQGNVAGGKTKVDAADNVIAMYQNLTMRDEGRMQLQMLKTRDSDGDGKRVMIKMDPATWRFTDASDEEAFPRASKAKSTKITQLRGPADPPEGSTRNMDAIQRLKDRTRRS